MRPALPGSYERVFHQIGSPSVLLLLDEPAVAEALRPAHGQRAIGVIYLPQAERASHYYHAVLPSQFDAVLHFDQTRSVRPLDRATANPGSAAHPGVPRR